MRLFLLTFLVVLTPSALMVAWLLWRADCLDGPSRHGFGRHRHVRGNL